MSRKIIITEPRKMTMSNIFIVPIFKIEREVMALNGFINSYLYNEERNVDYDDYCLHMLYHPPNEEIFSKFVNDEKYRLQERFIDEYDYEDGYSVLVYKIPEYLNNDIEILKEGKYSKLSLSLMSAIPSTVDTLNKQGFKQKEPSLAYMIYEKQPLLKEMWENVLNINIPPDAEVWERKTKEEETLFIEKIKQEISPFTQKP